MKKEYAFVIALFIGGLIYLNSLPQLPKTMVPDPTPSLDRSSCLADDCLAVDGLEYPAGKLSKEVKSALDLALDDEYKAYSTYQAIITKFGSSRPFSMIIGAEEQHIAQLKSIYTKYGEVAKSNPYLGKLKVPNTIVESCQAGASAEIANADLYQQKLLPLVNSYPDIKQVFTRLMDASRQKHLPAFERCFGR